MMDQMNPLTCAEFEAMVPDLLDGTLSPRDRERMDAHRLDCEECDSLAADLIDIKGQAAELPTLSASRDLWAGIENRIDAASVVEFPRTPLPGEVAAIGSQLAVISDLPPDTSRPTARRSTLISRSPRVRSLAAASVLVALTAGITWTLASRNAPAPVAVADSLTTPQSLEAMSTARAVSRTTMQDAYDKEIADLRKIVDDHKAELDSATAAVLERNLKLIDDAIAECKAALSTSPGSAFLLERLNDAYSSKLRTLRAVAVAPVSGDE
jgi:hypothetical protein